MFFRTVEAIRKGDFKIPVKKMVIQPKGGAMPSGGFTDIKPEDIPF